MNLELYREIAAQCQNHASVSHTECGGMLWGSGAAILRLIDMVEGLEAQLAARVPDAPYGYCPVCRSMGEKRDRSPNGHTYCGNGHKWLSSESLSAAPSQQAPSNLEALVKIADKQAKYGVAPHRAGFVVPTHFDQLTGVGIPDPNTYGEASQQAPVAQGEPVAWTNPGAKGKTFHEIMVQAHSFCPTDLPHLQKMQWMASYYEVNRQQQASEPMTVEQIKAGWANSNARQHTYSLLSEQSFLEGVRFAERHHNIKGSVSHAE